MMMTGHFCLYVCSTYMLIFTKETKCKRMCLSVHSYYLGRGMDPDGRVEQNVVAQLLEQHDAILQVAKVSGKGQHNVQNGPRHVHLGRLQCRQGDKVHQQEVRHKRWDDVPVYRVKTGKAERDERGTHRK